MQTQTQLEQDRLAEQKIQKLRDIFADAPQMAKTALENKIRDLASHVSEPRSRMESAGRTGSRQGKVSELTLMLTFAPGGARRLRTLLQAQNGSFDDADKVGTALAAKAGYAGGALGDFLARLDERIDVVGALLLTAGSFVLLYGLAQAAVLPLPWFVALTALGLLLLVAFGFYERSVTDPIWPMNLWRDRMSTSGNLVSLALGVTMMGIAA